MIKKLAMGGFGLVLLISPLITSADQVTDLQLQLQKISAQLAQLMAQRNATITHSADTTATTQGACVSISNILSVGATDARTGGDVTRLQKFLSAQGAAIYPEAKVTGYFGPATMRAVQRWQAAQGIISSGSPNTTGYGLVGVKTRTALNMYCAAGGISTLLSDVSSVQNNLADARAQGRDARRVSDLKQLQLGLELYYDEKGMYPATLGLLAPYYLAIVPKDPSDGADYPYDQQGAGTGYELGGNLEVSNNTALQKDDDVVDVTGNVRSAADTLSCAGLSGRFCYNAASHAPTNAPSASSSVTPPTLEFYGSTQLTVGETGTWHVKGTSASREDLDCTIYWNAAGTPELTPGDWATNTTCSSGVDRTFTQSFNLPGTFSIQAVVKLKDGTFTSYARSLTVSPKTTTTAQAVFPNTFTLQKGQSIPSTDGTQKITLVNAQSFQVGNSTVKIADLSTNTDTLSLAEGQQGTVSLPSGAVWNITPTSIGNGSATFSMQEGSGTAINIRVSVARPYLTIIYKNVPTTGTPWLNVMDLSDTPVMQTGAPGGSGGSDMYLLIPSDVPAGTYYIRVLDLQTHVVYYNSPTFVIPQ